MKCQRRGQTSSGGRAVDADVRRINTKIIGVLNKPVECREAVVQPRRERVFRCESVLDRSDHDAKRRRECNGIVLLNGDTAEDESPAVNVEQSGNDTSCPLRFKKAHVDLGISVMTRDVVIFNNQRRLVDSGRRVRHHLVEVRSSNVNIRDIDFR